MNQWDEVDNHKFCYAGSWYFQLDFTTGIYSQCSANADFRHNFFEHLDEELQLEPVGMGCNASFCWNGWAKILNLIPNECGYIETEKFALEPEFQFMSREALDAEYANLAETNQEYSKEEKEEHRKRQLQYEYFVKQVELLGDDFKKGNYLGYIAGAGKLLENDLNARLADVVQLVVWYGYALLRSGRAEEALMLETCSEDLNYNADYCLLMGLVYMQNGRIENAVRLLQDAMKKNFVLEEGTNTYLPCYNLGVIYECMGNTEKARSLYRDCGGYEPAEDRLREMGIK